MNAHFLAEHGMYFHPMDPLKNSTSLLHALGPIFFPHLCAGCGSNAIAYGQAICHRCLARFPETGFASQPDNLVEQLFWGRIRVEAACSGYYFTRSSAIQHTLHQLKYRGNREAGIMLGRMLGHAMAESNRFKDMELVVPMPLFPEKEKIRGYNQASLIANGISEVLNIKTETNIIRRKHPTETQTRKSRLERWENVEGVFEVTHPMHVKGKSILLTDDVVTTGASLESCGDALLNAGCKTLHIGTVAFAEQ